MILEAGDSKLYQVTKDQLKATFLLGENFIELMFNYAQRFNAFKLTTGEKALFAGLMLVSPGNHLETCDVENSYSKECSKAKFLLLFKE